MQAVRATRIQVSPVARIKRSQARPISDSVAKSKSQKLTAANEKTARSFFIAGLVFITCLVIIGFGPVVISAEATRSSQQAIILQQDIIRATTATQNLQLERSSLRSASRIEKVAREEMNMVPIGKNFIAIEIGPDVATNTILEEGSDTVLVDKKSPSNVLKNIARLTAGEASALLVGDISLATVR